MSLGRGKMLQSVRQKIEHDLEGRVCQFHMADYTNETIEKFCRELSEKGPDEYCKVSGDHPSGSKCDLSGVEIDNSQFDDMNAEQCGISSITGSMTSDADSSLCSQQSGEYEEETSSSFSLDDCNRSPIKSQEYSHKYIPSSRLAVRWPSPPTIPKTKIESEFPSITMGRGKRLQMVSAKSALMTKVDPQREIMMACDPAYTNDKIESYLDKMIKKNEVGEEL